MTNATIKKDEQFGYELTDEGRIKWFSYILDDFEEYIKSYWTKTQSENWDDIEVLPEAFRIDYITNQFDEDWDSELTVRNEDGDGLFDEQHDNWFTVKNTPENLKLLEDYGEDRFEVDEDDSSLINIRTLTEWIWIYYTQEFYSQVIKDDFACNTGIPLEDIQTEDVSVMG